MIKLTDFDYAMANHAARIERFNATWWMREAVEWGVSPRPVAEVTGVGPARRHIGQALVRAGDWLKGTPSASAPAVGAYATLDAGR